MQPCSHTSRAKHYASQLLLLVLVQQQLLLLLLPLFPPPVVLHTSASLTINENASPDVPLDLNVRWWEQQLSRAELFALVPMLLLLSATEQHIELVAVCNRTAQLLRHRGQAPTHTPSADLTNDAHAVPRMNPTNLAHRVSPPPPACPPPPTPSTFTCRVVCFYCRMRWTNWRLRATTTGT